jgi:hypothetical protein
MIGFKIGFNDWLYDWLYRIAMGPGTDTMASGVALKNGLVKYTGLQSPPVASPRVLSSTCSRTFRRFFPLKRIVSRLLQELIILRLRVCAFARLRVCHPALGKLLPHK